MLAAVPSENDRRLELLQLALMLIWRGTNALPKPLTDHFDRVLAEARSLANDPSAISDHLAPQAMQLANELTANPELREALFSVTSINDISPELAHRALRTWSQ